MSITYRGVAGGVALDLESRSPGSYASDDATNPDFTGATFLLLVYVSEITGSPSVTCWVEASADNGSTWSTIPGGEITLTDVGSASSNVVADFSNLIRVNSTVSGSGTPTITYRASVLTTAIS